MNKLKNSTTRFVENLVSEDKIEHLHDKAFEPEIPQGYFQNPFKKLGRIDWHVICIVAVCSCLFGGMNASACLYAIIGTACTLLTLTVTPRLFKVVAIPIIILAVALLVSGFGYNYISKLGFVSLSLVFLIRMAYKPSSNVEKIVSLALMLSIVIACFLINISYFVFMVSFVSVAMVLCNIYRRQVIHYWLFLCVAGVIMISAIFLLGRTAKDMSAEQRTELVVPYNVQQRLDRWKDAIFIRCYESSTQTNRYYTSFEHQIFGSIREHIGTTPSVLLILLVFFCLSSFVVSVQSCPDNNRVMPILCLLALLTDSLYYVTAKQDYGSTCSFVSHFIMIGVILSFFPKRSVCTSSRG